MRRDHFNFRDVLARLGMPVSDRRLNWRTGQILRKEAAKAGVSVSRPLTAKTDKSAKVGAPHCIAAYPMSFFPAALRAVKLGLDQRSVQPDLFEGMANHDGTT